MALPKRAATAVRPWGGTFRGSSPLPLSGGSSRLPRARRLCWGSGTKKEAECSREPPAPLSRPGARRLGLGAPLAALAASGGLPGGGGAIAKTFRSPLAGLSRARL